MNRKVWGTVKENETREVSVNHLESSTKCLISVTTAAVDGGSVKKCRPTCGDDEDVSAASSMKYLY